MMPPQDITNKLASIMAKVKKGALVEREPFPYFDIMDFMPNWPGVEQASDKKNIKMTAWLAAYTCIPVVCHIDLLHQIAWEARQENKSWKLAFAYDKLARKKWSEKDLRGLELVVSIRLV